MLQAVPKTAAQRSMRYLLICIQRPCLGRHLRTTRPPAPIQTGSFVGLLRFVFCIVVEIRSARYCYPALVGSGLIEQVGKHVREYLPRKTCAIISDSNVAPLFAKD